MIISSDETTAVVDVSACGRGPAGRRYQVTRAGVDAGDDEPAVVTIEVVGQQRDQLEVIVDHVRKAVRWARAGDSLWLDDGSAVTHFIDATHRPQAAAGAEASGRLVAPLDGSVIGVRVAEGDAVEKGQLVLVLEAMKMEHRIVAEIDGVVAAIHVTSGDQVKTRQLLAEIAAPESQ